MAIPGLEWLDEEAASSANLEPIVGTRAGRNGSSSDEARHQRNAVHPIGVAGIEGTDPPDPSTQDRATPQGA